MEVARTRRKLDTFQEAAAVEKRLKAEPPGWRRERLMAVQLGLAGELNLEEIASAVGRSRSRIQEWFDWFREGGMARLLEDQRINNHGPEGFLKPEAKERFDAEVAKGRFRTAPQIQRWVEKELGIKAAQTTIYGWLGKLGARMRVPRPSHVRKNPEAAEAFKEKLLDKLHSLRIAKGRAVRVWVMDEMRFGLHSFTRKVWITGKERPVAPSQQHYQWGYLYGAVGVSHGRSEFLFAETVDQEHLTCYYEQIGRSDPAAVHVIVQDGAGFHLRDGDPRLPENVRIILLPPYSPELNPAEKLWDQIKDAICNQVFTTIETLQTIITGWLREFWADMRRAFNLIGNSWLLDQVNASAVR